MNCMLLDMGQRLTSRAPNSRSLLTVLHLEGMTQLQVRFVATGI